MAHFWGSLPLALVISPFIVGANPDVTIYLIAKICVQALCRSHLLWLSESSCMVGYVTKCISEMQGGTFTHLLWYLWNLTSHFLKNKQTLLKALQCHLGPFHQPSHKECAIKPYIFNYLEKSCGINATLETLKSRTLESGGLGLDPCSISNWICDFRLVINLSEPQFAYLELGITEYHPESRL